MAVSRVPCSHLLAALCWACRLVGTRGRGIKAWHLDTKRMVSQVGLDPPFTDVADLACSPADPTFVCAAGTPKGGADGTGRLSLWNMRSFKKVHTFGIPGDPAISSLSFSPDGRLLVAGGVDGAVRLFDAAGKSVVRAHAV
jgi:WD40 repeat protein